MQETQGTQVQFLGQEDPLENEMATHSSILAWKIPWTERGAWQATVHGSQRVRQNEAHTHIFKETYFAYFSKPTLKTLISFEFSSK